MGLLAPQCLVNTQLMEGSVRMKLTLRLLAWMVAVLSITGSLSADEPLPTYVSYRSLESSLQAQSAELEQLRARLASLEREVAQVDASPSDRYVVTSGSDTCHSGCIQQTCCDPWVVYAGGEVVWVRPQFRNAVAVTIFDTASFAADVVPLDYDFELSGRYWLGFRGPGNLGARVRYWEWEHLAATEAFTVGPTQTPALAASIPGTVGFAAVTLNALPGNDVTISHRLEMATLDLEGTQDFQFGATELRLAAGLRYLRFNQDYAVDIDAAVNSRWLNYRQSFEGIGPTIALELKRELGFNLSLYAQARGSVTFGDRSDRIDAFIPPTFEITYSRDGADDLISVGEVGLGVQADLGSVFIRGGYEGQIWWNAGGPVDGTGDMGLHGVSVSVGINF